MHGAPLEAGLGVAIFQAEAGSASTPCVIPRLGTPLRIAGLLSECVLVPPADTISVVTAQESSGPPSGHVQPSCVCTGHGSPR